MHEAALARAALPSPTVCLGLLLRPFSLGHELRLIRAGNPLAHGWENPSPPSYTDLINAVLICCQSFEEYDRMGKDWLIGLKMRIWKWRARKLDFAMELARFINYRNDGSTEIPPTNLYTPGRTPQRRGGPGAPFILQVHQFLVMRMRLTPVEAWDHPYGLAKMQWATFMEGEGCLELYNAYDFETDKFVAEQEALMAQKGVAA